MTGLISLRASRLSTEVQESIRWFTPSLNSLLTFSSPHNSPCRKQLLLLFIHLEVKRKGDASNCSLLLYLHSYNLYSKKLTFQSIPPLSPLLISSNPSILCSFKLKVLKFLAYNKGGSSHER